MVYRLLYQPPSRKRDKLGNSERKVTRSKPIFFDISSAGETPFSVLCHDTGKYLLLLRLIEHDTTFPGPKMMILLVDGVVDSTLLWYKPREVGVSFRIKSSRLPGFDCGPWLYSLPHGGNVQSSCK